MSNCFLVIIIITIIVNVAGRAPPTVLYMQSKYFKCERKLLKLVYSNFCCLLAPLLASVVCGQLNSIHTQIYIYTYFYIHYRRSIGKRSETKS